MSLASEKNGIPLFHPDSIGMFLLGAAGNTFPTATKGIATKTLSGLDKMQHTINRATLYATERFTADRAIHQISPWA
jgi:hypothetical protein